MAKNMPILRAIKDHEWLKKVHAILPNAPLRPDYKLV